MELITRRELADIKGKEILKLIQLGKADDLVLITGIDGGASFFMSGSEDSIASMIKQTMKKSPDFRKIIKSCAND